MTTKQFISYLIDESGLLFYGELDMFFLEDLQSTIKYILSEEKKPPYFFDTNREYWYVVSILNGINLVGYGTSPRFPWLTKGGKEALLPILDMDCEEFEELLEGK